MFEADRETYTRHLSQYFHASRRLSSLVWSLNGFAHSESARDWIQKWSTEAATHHMIWDRLAKNRRFEPGKIGYNMWKLFDMTEGYVREKNWIGSMIGIAFIQHMLNAGVSYLYRGAEDDMKLVFKRIAGDQIGHLDFANREIARFNLDEGSRMEMRSVQIAFLAEFLEWPLRPETADDEIDILNDAYHTHRITMKREGIVLPKIYFSTGTNPESRRNLGKFIAEHTRQGRARLFSRPSMLSQSHN